MLADTRKIARNVIKTFGNIAEGMPAHGVEGTSGPLSRTGDECRLRSGEQT